MNTNIGKIVLFALALGIMVLGGDSSAVVAPAAAHATVSAVRTEKCPDCGQTIKLQMIGNDTWEFTCPKCGKAMRTEPTGFNTLSAKCPSDGTEIRLSRTQHDTVSFDCPGCGHQLVLKCPDCGQGVLKYQKISGEPAGALCASCHKGVELK